MSTIRSFFATCPKGLEDLLLAEIERTAATESRMTVAGVQFNAPDSVAYELCLWSRVANRVLLLLNKTGDMPAVESDFDLYAAATDIPWESHIPQGATIAVDFVGSNKAINNTLFGAMRVKDAIVDRLRDKTGQRPDVAKREPDVRIHARLAKQRIQFSLDFSGNSLHQRGYRTDQGAAPLKENLAAAILLRVGWPTIAKSGGGMIDPMCGSGTLLVEAAMIALDIAPGLMRTSYGFQHWSHYDPEVWQGLLLEATRRRADGLARGKSLRILGFDENPNVLRAAAANSERAGVAPFIRLEKRSIANFALPEVDPLVPGLVICNPPYGERLGEVESLRGTYQTLGATVKEQCAHWQLSVLTGNPELAQEMRLRPKKVNKVFNGALPCEVLSYDLLPASEAHLREDHNRVAEHHLSEGARMVVNRINKNLKRLSRWLKNNNVDCYRVYDADIPEYAAAVDFYAGQLHIQEYAAPKTIDEAAAEKRLRELQQAVAYVFSVPQDEIATKTRQRNRGKQQYERLSDTSDRALHTVQEGSAQFLVNVWDYLDTGLFLDHRPLRFRIEEEARGKRFLNLFCYTATATVHAALGGARESISVDMSHPYLQWAGKNFELNHVNRQKHNLVQADCVKWLNECRQGFDLIMLDPPSFSNSKRMDGVLDIQRDHVALVRRCMELLAPNGQLYFSSNLRGFKLEKEALDGYQIQDITRDTLDPDFERKPKIHHCFLVQHRPI